MPPEAGGPHPLGVFFALFFLVTLGSTLIWMLRLPPLVSPEVARAVYSVGSARCIVVPILDLFYTERAVELACRLGRQQNASLILGYLVEVPRLLTLDSPLPPDVQERADQALLHARRIVERHGLKAQSELVRTREGHEGIRDVVQAYQGDVVVLGVEAAANKVPSVFTRTAEALLRHPPCEVIVDAVPELANGRSGRASATEDA